MLVKINKINKDIKNNIETSVDIEDKKVESKEERIYIELLKVPIQITFKMAFIGSILLFIYLFCRFISTIYNERGIFTVGLIIILILPFIAVVILMIIQIIKLQTNIKCHNYSLKLKNNIKDKKEIILLTRGISISTFSPVIALIFINITYAYIFLILVCSLVIIILLYFFTKYIEYEKEKNVLLTWFGIIIAIAAILIK